MHLARLARRLSPDATIVFTGCYAETAADDIARLTGADLVLGNAAKPNIPRLLLARPLAGIDRQLPARLHSRRRRPHEQAPAHPAPRLFDEGLHGEPEPLAVVPV